MNRTVFLVALVGILSTGCKKADTSSDDDLKPAKVVREGAPTVAASPHGGATGNTAPAHTSPATGTISGPILETMNSGGYTYVKVKGPQGEVWAAAKETTVNVGDVVSFAPEMPMEGFHSNTLNRTFDLVYFVSRMDVRGGSGASPVAAAKVDGGTPPPAPAATIGKIEKAEGGKLISEIFAEKAALSGKQVSVRGKVVKFNSGIMGRNWIHLQDGSGAEGTNDLTVTTDAMTEVGATILVTGTVGTDKDFGAGYAYGVILESATISK